MPRTIKKLTNDNQIDNNSNTFQSNRQREPQIYRLQKNTPILKKQNQMNLRIVKIQILIILISVIMYASIFGIKYLIVNSTQPHEQVPYCQQGAKTFDGWNFLIKCTKCPDNLYLNETTNSCTHFNTSHDSIII